eukprot:2263478-Pleurochrysis_carterae.AAC.1
MKHALCSIGALPWTSTLQIKLAWLSEEHDCREIASPKVFSTVTNPISFQRRRSNGIHAHAGSELARAGDLISRRWPVGDLDDPARWGVGRLYRYR